MLRRGTIDEQANPGPDPQLLGSSDDTLLKPHQPGLPLPLYRSRHVVVKVMVVVDSVAALVPKAEIEGEMGDAHVGLQARLMSQALRKLTGNVHRSNTTLFFINQIRMIARVRCPL